MPPSTSPTTIKARLPRETVEHDAEYFVYGTNVEDFDRAVAARARLAGTESVRSASQKSTL